MTYPQQRRSTFNLPAMAAMSGAPEPDPYLYGAQSYSFRQFPLEDAIRLLKELNLEHMEFCAVHFPCDANHPGFDEVLTIIRAAGVRVPCFGVEAFTADDAANRRKFECAAALGAAILTADPAPDAFDSLEQLCDEFQIKIAIHNHGPGARYDSFQDTLRAVEGRSPLIGACVDTGHALRSNEAPHEVIAALGARVHSVHLKDWRLSDNVETVVGEGALELEATARELKAVGFSGPVMLEYEESPEAPVADMRKSLANWRAATLAV